MTLFPGAFRVPHQEGSIPMPVVERPAVLKAVYLEAVRKFTARDAPTELLPANQSLFRFFPYKYFHLNTDGVFPRHLANKLLAAYDLDKDVNRFTGQSLNANIPACGGLYCALQQQALVNELLHYTRAEPAPRLAQNGFPHPDIALSRKCVVRIRLMGARLLLDLSPHSSHAKAFIDDLDRHPNIQSTLRVTRSHPKPLWEQLSDPFDCTVARAIGLAAANSGYLHGIKALTVRPSNRSDEETGDNVIFFSQNSLPISGLWIDRAYVFPLSGPPQVIPVEA